VSLRRADIRFTLPAPARRAVVLPGSEPWLDGLRQAGVEATTDPGAAKPDLVVAPGHLLQDALALDPELLVLEGGTSVRALRASGRSPRVILPLPSPERPDLLLPLGRVSAVRYALRHWRGGGSAPTRARNAVARELLARGLRLPGRSATTVAARRDGPPFLVARALELVSSSEGDWFAGFSRFAHAYSRGAFYVFPPAEPEPAWVVKFARIPGDDEVFERDERGLRLARDTGGVVAGHAPSLFGRFEVDGLQASVESAATGERLAALLESKPLESAQEVLDRIAAWIVEVARETAEPTEGLAAERQRLATELVPRWTSAGLPPTIVEDLPPLAAVLQHGDLSGENIFVRNGGFTVVDWESARTGEMPLWDLFYFLNEALAISDGVRSEDERTEHFGRLWRGELPSSQLLFRWTRELAAAAKIPAEAVGPIATLLWLHYATKGIDHLERVERIEGVDQPAETAMMRNAQLWLADPALGPGWRRWLS
jgi:hypothetical protein